MKIRILRQAVGHVNGVSLRHYRPGQVYEVPPSIANYMVAEGLAGFEMRSAEHSAPPNNIERRRHAAGDEPYARDEEYSS